MHRRILSVVGASVLAAAALGQSAVGAREVERRRQQSDPVRRGHDQVRDGGRVLVAEEPYWYFYNGDQSGTHSGPWAYDTYVPVIIAGPNINSQRIARDAAPEDIAVTLANILGILPPSGNTGQVLLEALPKGH